MSSGEINNKVIYSTDNMISKIGFSNSSAKWVKEKSVLIALAGQGKTRGTVAISEIPLTTNQSIAAIQPDSFLYYKFLFQNLEGRYNELREVSSGDGTRGGLNKQIISDLEVLAPEIQEQIIIGDFLCGIDNLITLHQREYFSLRFGSRSAKIAQNTLSWEQRKVGELTVESSEYTTLEAGFPLLTSSRNGLMYQNEYRGKQTTDSTETMFSIVPLGACTYRHMSDDDVFHLNVNRLEKGLVSREYPVFYASDDNNLDFIVQQINSSAEFRSFCAEQKKGGTRTRLYYKNLCEFQMLIPNTEEQEKIAKFLLTLDSIITLHQHKPNKKDTTL